MKRQTDYGYEIKPVYTPKDIEDLDYAKDVGDPGSYPFVRGYHPNGYRNRVWTRRMTGRARVFQKNQRSAQAVQGNGSNAGDIGHLRQAQLRCP